MVITPGVQLPTPLGAQPHPVKGCTWVWYGLVRTAITEKAADQQGGTEAEEKSTRRGSSLH